MSTVIWKKSFFLGMLAMLFIEGAVAASAVVAPWQTGSPVFTTNGASREPRPVLLYFTAKWCGFCQQMQRTTLAEPEVLTRLGRVRAYKLDFDVEANLAKKFSVSGIPAFVLTNDRGEIIDGLTGARPTADFLVWLTRAESEFATRAETAAAIATALQALPSDARSTDVATRSRAAETLWTLAGRADEFERTEAVEILMSLVTATGSGPLWRTGLGHGDLAVRIAAANLLQQTSKGSRSFDPWTHEDERSQALAQLGF